MSLGILIALVRWVPWLAMLYIVRRRGIVRRICYEAGIWKAFVCALRLLSVLAFVLRCIIDMLPDWTIAKALKSIRKTV